MKHVNMGDNNKQVRGLTKDEINDSLFSISDDIDINVRNIYEWQKKYSIRNNVADTSINSSKRNDMWNM